MKLKTLIAVAVAGAFAAPFAASAGSDNIQIAQAATSQPQAGSAALFERLDRNKDGFVSRDEARDATELQGRFAELDKDNDGKISRGEMGAMDSDRSATGMTGSGSKSGSTGGMGGSSKP